MLVIACFLFPVICTSCGAVGSDPPPPATLTVTPISAKSFPGGHVQFSAIVENAPSSTVNWQVNGTSSGNVDVGTIDSTGLYTAPNAVPSSGSVTITAVLRANPSLTGSAIVGIQGSLSLSPAHSSFSAPQPVQLTVLGTNVGTVNWAVDDVSGGNSTVGIVLNGLYDPPPGTGSHVITASLVADSSVSGSATVAITGFQGTLTWRNDNSRSGLNNQELALSPSTVGISTFGKLFSCPIDGYAYAQPLYVPNLPIPGNGTRNVVFVATENDSVFAFDADASPCAQLWKTSLIQPGEQPIVSTTFMLDISPTVGITGTPVIDLSLARLYAVAVTQDISPGLTYKPRLYALDLSTGKPPEIRPFGTEIATATGQASPFKPTFENQRTALLQDNGTVYIAFGSYGLGDYHGWLFAYDAITLDRAASLNTTPIGSGGGVWQSGGGPSADSGHYVFVLTGEGLPNQGTNYSDSFLRLRTDSGLALANFLTPCDQGVVGPTNSDPSTHSMSSAPVILPDSAGSSSQPHPLIGGSKEGLLYVVNRDDLGGLATCFDSQPSVQVVAVGDGPILSTPLYWNKAVFVAAANGKLKSFPMPAGILASAPSGPQSPETLGPQGATPVISSNGTGNAILWLIDTSGALTTPNSPAILRAYDPTNLSNEIYSSPSDATSPNAAGLAVKFAVPTVANGKVYVGTQNELDVYGFIQ